ncbi:MAG TPA: glycoside hydrolase family 31 protein [Verrucomicrobiota bacterium]|nr:glycoside hydrolase family 31 protein [Verrucomicrobiota bacterium]
MPNPKVPTPITSLRLARSEPRSFVLQDRKAVFCAEAIGVDLFRIRLAPGKRLPDATSWAVIKRCWEPVEAKTVREGDRISLTTSAGRLTVWMKTGAWELSDPNGLKLFTSAGGDMAFAGKAPRLTLDLVEGESLWGLGETTGQFNRRGLVREFWNIDVLGHAPVIYPGLKQLYVSIPFAISLRDGRAAGLFWDNPAKQSWDLGQTHPDRWLMSAASGELDLYLFLGPSVASVVRRYSELTGTMPLPPKWGLGYQQSRYSYETRARVEEIAREFRRRKLPCDVIYLDIHHMQGYRVFTFGKKFPKPAQMTQRLATRGFKVVTIVDPGVKDDPRFGVLRRGRKAEAFVKDPTGKKDFIGEVWPGRSRFPDFLNWTTREWWGVEQKALLDAGIAGFWNDMNEPANFARKDKTLHPQARHHTDFGPRRHHTVHNVYGMQMARASRDGSLRWARSSGRAVRVPRPFVITRAGYAGIQRHALVWTGDNSSSWDHLNDAVQMLLNLSLSGVPFCGGDVGGFLDNTTPELFVRWFQFAAFTPFFRDHSNIGTIDQEPWAFGKSIETICRTYLNLRYQLLPYLYALMAEAHTTGSPIIRPLLWHYQNDPVAVACGDQFLLGRDLLVAPVLRQGAVARSVYLPNDVWFNFWTGERVAGGGHLVAEASLGTLPLFVRAGAMLPFGPGGQYVGAIPGNPIALHCWPGADGCLNWYEDDGTTQAYETGAWSRRSIASQTRGRTLRLSFAPVEGPFPSAVKTWRLIVWGARRQGRFTVNGQRCDGHWVADQCLFTADVVNDSAAIAVEYAGV